MKFISYAELTADITAWASRLPRDYDIIVAVPRSGVIPASVLALHLNVKLTTTELWANGKAFNGGLRDQRRNPSRALVLDDSLNSGKSIAKARKLLSNATLVDYAAVYVKPGQEHLVDYYCKKLEMPRVFEWNWMHHYWLRYACMDIDGVLCEDPKRWENDDGPKYSHFLANAVPRFIPTVQVNTLVTSRLSRFRRQTEIWLAKNHVSYKKLIMHPAKTKAERQQMADHAQRKARAYRQSEYRLFVESSERQAKVIYQLSGKPVLCTDNMVMYS